MAIDPTQFNLQDGIKKLGIVALVSSIISVAMYLKSSPVPD